MTKDQPLHSISAEMEKACAQEPIHVLGTVQSYGFLMVVELVHHTIVQVSSGITRHWPGLQDTARMLGTPLADWVTLSNQQDLSILHRLPEVRAMALPWSPRMSATKAREWECLAHRSATQAIIEWLPTTSPMDELRPGNNHFADVAELIGRLRIADCLHDFFVSCVQVVQDFSGFDRVMIYRFLEDGSGEVIAEKTGNGHTQKFLGLRFPASDIPSQARRLYLTNRLRILADVEAPTDTLIPPLLPNGQLLDQSYSLLRGLSPVHLAYLHNMGVRTTFTISIIANGKLWGLIACHHYQAKLPPNQIRDGLRLIFELIAEVTNMRVETLSQLEDVRHRLKLNHLLNRLHHALLEGGDIVSVVQKYQPELLAAFNATNIGFRLDYLRYLGGPGPQRGSTNEVLEEVSLRLDLQHRSPTVQVWDALLGEAGQALHGLPTAAGLLLAQRFNDEMGFLFLAREEVVQQVSWGGEPVMMDNSPLPDGQIHLEPRRSFTEWKQSVRGRSAPWTSVEIDSMKTLMQILSEIYKLQINRELHQKLHWRAHHDQLTGLFNRKAMELEVTKRLDNGHAKVVLMLLNIDHFKKINDTYGHETGDQLLQHLSLRLAAVVREDDLLARLGGDEFMLLLQVANADPALALAFAERLHKVLGAALDVGGQQLRIDLSIGIAIPPAHGTTVGELLRHADLALFHAKSLGRSHSVIFEPSMASDQLDYYLLERDLREAVERDQLSLVFQPKVDLETRRVVGLEAMVRWHHPTRGLSEPADFIPVAERNEQIVEIDRWVMRTVIRTQAEWRASGRPLMPVAINLSMADILSPNLVSDLTSLLAQSGLSADALEVEVTESCMMLELAETQRVLSSLTRSGFFITLDDFGTGFSSLSYLRQLPVKCLKIDKSFTQSMLLDQNAEKLTQTILAMGSALKMRIVAEGVETREQMQWLIEHGCDIGQGFLFSPPVPADEVHHVIRRIEAELAAMA